MERGEGRPERGRGRMEWGQARPQKGRSRSRLGRPFPQENRLSPFPGRLWPFLGRPCPGAFLPQPRTIGPAPQSFRGSPRFFRSSPRSVALAPGGFRLVSELDLPEPRIVGDKPRLVHCEIADETSRVDQDHGSSSSGLGTDSRSISEGSPTGRDRLASRRTASRRASTVGVRVGPYAASQASRIS